MKEDGIEEAGRWAQWLWTATGVYRLLNNHSASRLMRHKNVQTGTAAVNELGHLRRLNHAHFPRAFSEAPLRAILF